MTKNDKYTILIDGNFLLHKTYHVAKHISNGKFDFIKDPAADKNLLLWKLSMDFAAELKRFDSIIENVIYCIDGSSWRKHYFPKADIEQGENIKYKANRVQSNDIDWGLIYETHQEFAKGIEKLGIKTVRLDGCEADDLIFAYSSVLNAKGRNALVISGDGDLTQLVNHDDTNNANTIYYNKFAKTLYVAPGFTDWVSNTKIQAIDIFNQPIDITDNSKDGLKSIVKSLDSTDVNTAEFQFKKIIKGDSGDNVAPLYAQPKVYKSGKKKGQEYFSTPSDKQINEVLKTFNERYDTINPVMFWNKDIISEICGLVKMTCKYNDVSMKQLEKNYADNRNLMILHEKAIPTPIMESMTNNIAVFSNLEINKSELNALKDYKNILDETSYEEKEKKKQSSGGFFNSFNLD